MILIVCIEKKDGMLFGGKRLSQDRIVREKMLSLSENSRLWVSPYTAKQFASFFMYGSLNSLAAITNVFSMCPTV